MEQLIRRDGGHPFVASSVKEMPVERHDEAYGWADRLFAHEFDLLVLMTGAGLTYLRDLLGQRYLREVFIDALRQVILVSRGPKPDAVLREMGLAARITVPEPNTWHDAAEMAAPILARKRRTQKGGQCATSP